MQYNIEYESVVQTEMSLKEKFTDDGRRQITKVRITKADLCAIRAQANCIVTELPHPNESNNIQ